MQFFTASHKVIQNLNFNYYLYAITFFCVTFAELWTGTFLMLAIDYDSYAIARHCPFFATSSSDGKYVFWGESLTCQQRLYLLSHLML